MKTKEPVRIKKQTVTVKDLKTRKNPKGGRQTSPNIHREYFASVEGVIRFRDNSNTGSASTNNNAIE